MEEPTTELGALRVLLVHVERMQVTRPGAEHDDIGLGDRPAGRDPGLPELDLVEISNGLRGTMVQLGILVFSAVVAFTSG